VEFQALVFPVQTAVFEQLSRFLFLVFCQGFVVEVVYLIGEFFPPEIH
jgi:hypothetical protein